MTDDFRTEMDAEEEVLTLTDEDGNEISFLVQGRVEWNGRRYLVLEDMEDEGSVMIFTDEVDENGEQVLNPVEDEDECQTVFDYYIADIDDYEFCDAE